MEVERSDAPRLARRAKVFAMTKGFYGRRKNCYSIAVRAAERAMQNAYIGRKLKKRDMRTLWIERINAGAREHGTSYSRFINGLVHADVQLNRKVMAELAMHEPRSFASLTALAQEKHKEAQQGLRGLL